jgi:zinc transport system ATP-binding protein
MVGKAISIRDLNFAYSATPVIENASLDVHEGEVVCIAGPNGGGKTTLLRLILGLLKPESGTIRVLGLPPAQARGKIGYMPQQLHYDNLFPITVEQVVLMGRMRPWHFRHSREDREETRLALMQVGLDHLASSQFSALSGGQRQRALIARAFVSSPRLLLLDEPTAMIDAQSQSSFARTLETLRTRCTIVIVSHDIGFVSSIVDKVLLVNRTVSEQRATNVDKHSFEELYGEKLRDIGHAHGYGKQEQTR